MTISISAALVAAAVVQFPAAIDGAKVERRFKLGEADSYAVSATMEMGGVAGKAVGNVSIKALKLGKDDAAEVELSLSSFSLELGGSDTGAASPEKQSVLLDKRGVPGRLEVKEASWIYAIVLLAGYCPGEVETGKEFPIEWSTKDKSLSVKGVGKLVEIQDVAGEKVAVIKGKIKVNVADDVPGEIEYTSKISVSSGKLLSSEGKLRIEDGTTAAFTVKKDKPSDK